MPRATFPFTSFPREALAWEVLFPQPIAPAALLVAAGEKGVTDVVFLGVRAGDIDRALKPLCMRGLRLGGKSRREARENLARAISELEQYFSGKPEPFRVPFDLEGRAPRFDLRVWKALRKIPFGKVTSYGDFARHLGVPRAARAVGRSLAKNPLPILLPCHRVVGADGRLAGFTPGVGLKARLLVHEGVALTRSGEVLRVERASFFDWGGTRRL